MLVEGINTPVRFTEDPREPPSRIWAGFIVGCCHVAKCALCGAETELRVAEVPVCLDCVEKQEEKKPTQPTLVPASKPV